MIRLLITGWILISSSTTATVYNAVPEQCGSNPTRTASGFRIDPAKVSELRIIAMERTMMQRHGIRYGDKVLIEGTGKYDGEWTVEDTMHSKWAGQDRIDFLVPETVRLGKWKEVKIYKEEKEAVTMDCDKAVTRL